MMKKVYEKWQFLFWSSIRKSDEWYRSTSPINRFIINNSDVAQAVVLIILALFGIITISISF